MHLIQQIMRLNKSTLFNRRKAFSLAINNILKCKKNLCPGVQNFLKLVHTSSDGMETEEPNLNTEYNEISNQFLNPAMNGHGVLVIQPYIKWGQNKRRDTTPQLQLMEATSLINTLSNWSVIDSMCISLMGFGRKKLFGKGNLSKLAQQVRSNSEITAVFVSINLLRPVQISQLELAFGVPIYDRYSIVIQIFRDHAKTAEAKLQVALAELPYIWKKLSWISEDSDGRINLPERRKMILHARENKLKTALEKLKEHRKLLRRFRTSKKIPTVAVVGYTNAGKTCLIKALTDDKSLEPQNKLFATLDTTSHEGLLPCKMKILFMDTIGFIQDIPEGLLEPFIATFEDAVIADVIVHVYDASHPDRSAQIQHVRETLNNIMSELEITSKPIIEVANKCDIAPKGSIPNDVIAISSLNLTGTDLLLEKIEKELIKTTGRKLIKVRVQSGSTAAAWLYKETTVTNANPDPNDFQYLILTVITTDLQMIKFKNFLKS